MTQPPPIPQSSSRNRNIWIVMLVIGLVVGLVLGIFVSVLFNLPSSFHTGVGTNNQVQVSGTVQVTQTGSILFTNLNKTISSSAPILNGKYSILLVGGQSYVVEVSYTDNYGYQQTAYYSLYIPLGVTTFAGNF